MKIKLIQPAMLPRPMDTKLKTRMSPSLALLTIANRTPKEHQVIIENENVEKIDFNEPVDLVAITVTVDVMNRAVEISKEFRKRGVKVIAGGIHITSVPEETIDSFDAIIVGMAERVWAKVLNDKENNSLKKIYHDMDNISGNEIVSPDYSIIDNKKYLYTNIISTSRGCPFKCDFCYNSCTNSLKTYINRSIDDVVKDINALKTRHIMTPYPGTKLYGSLLEKNRIVDFNLSNYNTSHVVYKPKNMTAEELYNGYLWIYKEVYTFKNIMKRLPKSKKQWIPFLTFNLLYRKFGKLTELLCNIVSFKNIGRFSSWFVYRIK